MNNHIPALYTPTPTLAELYEEDSTLFAMLSLPEGLEIADVANVLLLKFKTLETIFASTTEAKAGFGIWSAALVENWTKMWETLQESYKPLENYSMIEEMEDDETVTDYGKTTTRTDNLTHTKTGTETTTPDLTEEETPNLTETETPNETTTTSGDVFGFNSVLAVPDSGASSSRTGTVTNATTGTNTRTTTGTSETEYDTRESDTGTETHTDSGSDTQTRNYKLTRSGNIGVTTSQQMLESEMLLRCKWNMYEIIANAFRHDLCICVW